MSEYYSLGNLWRAIREPGLLIAELRRINEKLNRNIIGSAGESEDVMSADWDNLLILDACRYDLLSENTSLPGTLRCIDTGSSDSEEFMERHFSGTYHDVVYVTSNPYAVTIEPGTFHALINLFTERWDSDLGTVHPEAVTDAALDAATKYPNKRLIVHYMQPHFPFIGEFGRTLETGNLSGRVVGERVAEEDRPSIWGLLQNGRTSLSIQDVENAYRENLEIVEREVRRFWDETATKTVVSADHGNLIGERLRPLFLKAYGHPKGVYHPALREVPWLSLSYTSRKDIIAQEPVEAEATHEVASEVVNDRLQNLGYKT